MDKEKLMELLRNPQKHKRKQPQKLRPAQRPSRLAPVVFVGVLVLVAISLVFIFSAQRKAENISDFIDTNVLKGLMVDRTFSPQGQKRYIQISEGAERTIASKSGGTLPVISRYNFRSFPTSNYQLIGAAPWAISINIVANAEDPEILHYLLNKDDMINSFLAREDVAALLDDPVMLGRLAANEDVLREFFAQEAAQTILASPKLIEAFSTSRFFSYLLISKAAKYYRDHPEVTTRLIRNSPTLSALKENEAIRKAVSENTYLKSIAPTLLK